MLLISQFKFTIFQLALTNPKPTVVDTESNTNPPPEAFVATTQVESLEVIEVSTQSDSHTSSDISTSMETNLQSSSLIPDLSTEISNGVNYSLQKLFLALHVYSQYKEKTGKDLPENVDYFGKSLLGLTSILGFRETVDKSVQAATIFLDVSCGVPTSIFLVLLYICYEYLSYSLL